MADVNYREMFANRLRALRNAADLTIEQASERGGLSPNFWGTVERNEQEPCLDSLFGFAEGIGVTPATLLTFENQHVRSEHRKELNELLDLFTSEQLHVVLQISKVIRGYRLESHS